VLRDDGTPCAPNEPGELVHRGALVGMGYWNDPEKTAERYKPLPGREAGLVRPEIAVFSGDTVRMDEEGFLYFIGRRDEMIKTSGYRISPTEIEEVVYATQRVGECAAFGVDHPSLGQAVVLVVTPGRARRWTRRRCWPTAGPACRSTWCRRRSRCAPARCRATRTARSTARLSADEFRDLFAGSPHECRDCRASAGLRESLSHREWRTVVGGMPSAARGAGGSHAVLCLRPDRTRPRTRRALRALPSAGESICTTR
jgi:hypothetical protein